MRTIKVLALSTAMLAAGALSALAQVTEYYHLDGIGNVRAVTNQSGNVIERHDYLPFGEECTTGVCQSNPQVGEGQPKKFTGKERDTETGLDYFGARYYGNSIGRFTTVDPVLDSKTAIPDPQRWNRYAYVSNRPVLLVDPDGREQPTVMNGKVVMGGVDGESAGDNHAKNVMLGVLGGGALLSAAAPAIPEVITVARIAAGTCLTTCQNIIRAILEVGTGTPGAAGQLPSFTATTIEKALVSAAVSPGRGPSVGLRGLASHVDRDAAFAGVAKTEQAAQGLIKGILQNPTRVAAGNHTVDAYNAAGQGVRIEIQSGKFVGFLAADKASR